MLDAPWTHHEGRPQLDETMEEWPDYRHSFASTATDLAGEREWKQLLVSCEERRHKSLDVGEARTKT